MSPTARWRCCSLRSPQKARKRLSAELKIDLKLVSLSIKDAPTEETRYSKLAIVREYITDSVPIGTVDGPKEYFEGSLPMRWGPLLSGQHQALIYFGARTDRTTLGLAGSMGHVIGAGGASQTHEGSWGPALHAALAREADGDGDHSTDLGVSERAVRGGVVNATANQRGPAEQMEFLARRILHSVHPEGEYTVLLGSPIYVAYAR
jgi:hypothetical protein